MTNNIHNINITVPNLHPDGRLWVSVHYCTDLLVCSQQQRTARHLASTKTNQRREHWQSSQTTGRAQNREQIQLHLPSGDDYYFE